MDKLPECPSDETLALLPDGRASRRVRRELIAHLDQCSRCRMALAYAGQYASSLEPARDRASAPWWAILTSGPRLAPALSVLAAAAVVVLALVVFPMRDGPSRLSTEAVVHPLFENGNETPSYSSLHWSGQANTFGFGSGPTHEERSFRIGVQQVDLRVAVEENQLQGAAEALEKLRSLWEVGEDMEPFSHEWAALGEKLESGDEGLLEELAHVESRLDSELHAAPLALGRWAEASRLAAASRHSAYFDRPDFRRVLETLEHENLPAEVREELQHVRTLTASRPSEQDLHELERSLRQILLLY